MYHSIIDFFEQTSMLVLLSLGFIFVISFIFSLCINKGIRDFLSILVGFVRALFLTLLFCAVLGGSFLDFSSKNNNTILLLVDNSESMNAFGSIYVKKQLDLVIHRIQSKYKGDKILFYSLEGKLLNQNKIIFNEKKSSLQKISKIIHNLNKNHELSAIYLFSDGQLDDYEGIFNTHYLLNVIPFGKIIVNKGFEIDVPKKTILSVPDEEVLIPVTLDMGQIFGPMEINMEVYVDNHLNYKKQYNITKNDSYQMLSVPVKSNKVGKHALLVKVFSHAKVKFKNISWQVVKEKANVNAFTIAPHPDLGVLNRIAKDMHITLQWTFGNSPKEKFNKVLFYGDVKNKMNYLSTDAILEINTSSEKAAYNYQHNNWNLWECQMKEQRSFGHSNQLDSTLSSWFTQAFLKNKDRDNVYYFENNEIKENEDLVFHVESDLLDNQKVVQLKLIHDNQTAYSTTYKYELSNPLNQFQIKGLKTGKYDAFVRLNQVGPFTKIDQVVVSKYLPEALIGRNTFLFNRLALFNQIDIVESDQILTSPKKESFSNEFLLHQKSSKALYEFPMYWYSMLILLFLEWLFRKKMDLI